MTRFSRAYQVLIAAALSATPVFAAPPTIDGRIQSGEGWQLLTEAANGFPNIGGQTATSDAVAESSTFHWWNGLTNSDVPFFDNRADVINVYISADSARLYLAVAGPTAPFNRFTDQGALASNDVGDLYVALELVAPGGPTSLAALSAHNAYGNRAVDFLGWSPTHILAVQFVDNGGGGGGGANVQTTRTQVIIAGEGQNQNNGGFDWHAQINSSAAYDAHNGNAGEFEFAIPWSLLLGTNCRPAIPLRIAAYVTQNFAGSDVYDSAPGLGNGTLNEQLGDCPGDPDAAGQLGACDAGSNFGSTAGADFAANLNGAPANDDFIDTIESYLVIRLGCPGDLNFDNQVDEADLGILLGAWELDAGGDLNCDGQTGPSDLGILLAAWRNTCP